jgi:hypothetical protein
MMMFHPPVILFAKIIILLISILVSIHPHIDQSLEDFIN